MQYFLKLAAAMLGALSLLAPLPARADDTPLVFFAAASLKDSLDKVISQWKAKTGGEVTASYASSSALIKQIEAGAPADLFASADLDWMDYGETHGLIKSKTRKNLLGNQLVIIAPASSTVALTIAPGFDLSVAVGEGRIATGDIKSVPAGKYAKAALEKLGAWTSVESKLAMTENVRAALALVSRGEVPLGIVYATDAKADPGVKVVGVFPTDSHPPIVYPFAVAASSKNPKAEAFLTYLQSAQARSAFEEAGFQVLE